MLPLSRLASLMGRGMALGLINDVGNAYICSRYVGRVVVEISRLISIMQQVVEMTPDECDIFKQLP